MKMLIVFMMAAILCVGLTFAGRAIFGMGDSMRMSDVACLNHCIDQATIVGVTQAEAEIVVLLIVLVFFTLLPHRRKFAITMTAVFRRLTEPIRLFLLSKLLSPVIIRD